MACTKSSSAASFFRLDVHHDDARVRRRFLDAFDEPLAAVAAQRGVDEHHVRLVFLESLQRGRAALGGGDYLELGLRVEQSRETVPQQAIVFNNEYLNSLGHCTDGRGLGTRVRADGHRLGNFRGISQGGAEGSDLILWDEAAKTASNPPALAFFEVRSEW